jgi:hypothetical protein
MTDRQIGEPRDLVQQRQPVHPRHVSVGQNDDEFRPDVAGEFLERLARGGEVQHMGNLESKALPEEIGDIEFVVDRRRR